MFSHSCNGTNIFIRWKMKCTIQLGFASLNGTFHLSPHENICTIALINIHYLYTILYYTILYYTILYYTNYYTVLYCTVLYCTVLYCSVLYCTVLYCTVLYYTARFSLHQVHGSQCTKEYYTKYSWRTLADVCMVSEVLRVVPCCQVLL